MVRMSFLFVILFCLGCTNDNLQSKTEALIKQRRDIDKYRDFAKENSIRLAKETLLNFEAEYRIIDIEKHGVSMNNEICRHEREVIRGKVLSEGKMSLLCLPDSYQFAYSRPLKSNDSPSFECDPEFRPGFILVGKIIEHDTNSIDYKCMRGI